MTKSFAKALGIEYAPAIIDEPKVAPKTELLVVSEKGIQVSDIPSPEDVKEDYKLARSTFHDIIKKGADVLNTLEQVGKECESNKESIRVAEVMSVVMKTLSDTTKDMFLLQKMTKDLKESTSTGKKTETNVNVDKAVFVGTTSELLKKVKSE